MAPNSQIHLLDLNRLLNNNTSRATLSPAPVAFNGAGVMGTFRGAGVLAYW